jgi:hypothetical protein
MKDNNKESYKNLVILLLIFGIVISIGYTLFNKPEIIYQDKLIEDNRAILNTEYLGLYENIDNSLEMFFQYRVDNFGNEEAKNVKVNCKIWDKNNNIEVSVIDNVGNIASKSFYLGEVVTNNKYTDKDGTLSCYIDSCDNCIILYKNIPELTDKYDNIK